MGCCKYQSINNAINVKYNVIFVECVCYASVVEKRSWFVFAGYILEKVKD